MYLFHKAAFIEVCYYWRYYSICIGFDKYICLVRSIAAWDNSLGREGSSDQLICHHGTTERPSTLRVGFHPNDLDISVIPNPLQKRISSAPTPCSQAPWPQQHDTQIPPGGLQGITTQSGNFSTRANHAPARFPPIGGDPCILGKAPGGSGGELCVRLLDWEVI